MMKSSKFLIIPAMLSLALHGPAFAIEQEKDRARDGQIEQQVIALQSLQTLDQRLHAAGYRLLSGNAGFCNELMDNSGLLLHDIRQYGNAEAARLAYGFNSEIGVNAVAPESPAAANGLLPNDDIKMINALLPSSPDLDGTRLRVERPEYYRIEALNNLLGNEPITRLVIERDGTERTVTVSSVSTCISQFQIRPSEKMEASADGRMVTVTSALAEYVPDENELAAIVAHELAHNLLKHSQRLNEQKVNRGFFGQFGKSAKRIKETEIEADRLSVWLMANAGYDPAAAITFWTRYGKEHGKGIFSASTHYRWKKRVKLFEEEIAKMETLETGGGKLSPPLLVSD